MLKNAALAKLTSEERRALGVWMGWREDCKEIGQAQEVLEANAPKDLTPEKFEAFLGSMVQDLGFDPESHAEDIECMGTWIRTIYQEGLKDALGKL